MSGAPPTSRSSTCENFQLKTIVVVLASDVQAEPMAITIQMATTGEELFTEPIHRGNESRVWELRLRFWEKYKSTPFFGWVFFHERRIVDDAALVSAYSSDPYTESIIFHVVVRELRPPTKDEEIAVRDCIQLRHRCHLWTVLSKGIFMASLLRQGTAWEATLVKAITADYPPTFDIGPLPDSVTTLLLAQCDPNIVGHPSLSPLGTAIRRGEERVVEVLLQFQADPHLKEEREELPLILAIARRATNCVKLLLDYRADPYITMSAPSLGPHGAIARRSRYVTTMEIATSYPASPDIVALLRTAMEKDTQRQVQQHNHPPFEAS